MTFQPSEDTILAGVCLVLLRRLAAVEKEIMPGPPYHDKEEVVVLKEYLQREVGSCPDFNELLKEVPGLTEAYYDIPISRD
jgi:hypothetical protein